MPALFPKLVLFEETIDRHWMRPVGPDYRAAAIELAVLIGASPDIVEKWEKAPPRDDLVLTADQVRLCEMLTGPHGEVVKRMLEVRSKRRRKDRPC